MSSTTEFFLQDKLKPISVREGPSRVQYTIIRLERVYLYLAFSIDPCRRPRHVVLYVLMKTSTSSAKRKKRSTLKRGIGQSSSNLVQLLLGLALHYKIVSWHVLMQYSHLNPPLCSFNATQHSPTSRSPTIAIVYRKFGGQLASKILNFTTRSRSVADILSLYVVKPGLRFVQHL